MQHFNWLEEVQYIQSVMPSMPGKSFNNDPECFRNYCTMQSRSAYQQAQWDAVVAILEHINGPLDAEESL